MQQFKVILITSAETANLSVNKKPYILYSL